MSSLPVQTESMSNKKILRVHGRLNDKIVCMAYSPSLFVDDMFYKQQMGEKSDAPSNPVKIVGLKIGWILTRPEGKKFLFDIQNSKNLEIYDNEALQMIIEFFYK
jgi:hypothetical protein